MMAYGLRLEILGPMQRQYEGGYTTQSIRPNPSPSANVNKITQR